MTSTTHTSLAAKILACAVSAHMGLLPATSAETSKPSVAKLEPTWRTDLPSALVDAAKQDKTVLLRFTANWCAPCRVMDARVWPDPTVKAALAKDFIIVKSDVDEEVSQVLAQKYGIRGVPTLLLLDGQGAEVNRGGFMSSPELIKFLATSRK